MIHYRKAVTHGECLLLVVSDVDKGDSDLPLEGPEFDLKRLTKACVQGS